MDRRAFISSVTGGLLAAPLAADAQQAGKVYRIGALTELAQTTPPGQGPFYDRMRELGWVYGRDYLTERRTFGDQIERIPDLATELMRSGVDVFLITGAKQAALLQQVAGTIPIVSSAGGDLVAAGLVASLARPGGNITGVQTQTIQIAGKHLSLLKEIIPRLSRVGMLTSDSDLMPQLKAASIRDAEDGAKALNIRLQVVTVRGAGEFEAAYAAFRREGAQALLVHRSATTMTNIKSVTALALAHRLPTMCDNPFLVTSGGLMSYGVNWDEMPRSVADATDKIFRGVKASEIPIHQVTTFWLAINLKTAKALGLTIPPSLLQRADQVIE
jgi:putative ABC transport system substrate-binding protein